MASLRITGSLLLIHFKSVNSFVHSFVLKIFFYGNLADLFSVVWVNNHLQYLASGISCLHALYFRAGLSLLCVLKFTDPAVSFSPMIYLHIAE